jgi:O-methyltransferase
MVYRTLRTIKDHTLRALDVVGLGAFAQRSLQYLKARGLTPWMPLVPETEFYDCVRGAIKRLRDAEATNTLGDYLEFGVSRGTSMACVHRALHDVGLHHVRLIGFDSFEGMPPEAGEEGWAPGAYHSTLDATRHYLVSKGVDLSRVTLVKGWFKDTLTAETRDRHGIGKTSLIMVDCDIYSASKEALKFCEPYIQDQAVIMFDDWGWRSDHGEVGQKEAFEEFLAEHPDLRADALPSYLQQARVFFMTRISSLAHGTVRGVRAAVAFMAALIFDEAVCLGAAECAIVAL